MVPETVVTSLPPRERELKHHAGPAVLVGLASLPPRERELKHGGLGEGVAPAEVAPPAGA